MRHDFHPRRRSILRGAAASLVLPAATRRSIDDARAAHSVDTPRDESDATSTTLSGSGHTDIIPLWPGSAPPLTLRGIGGSDLLPPDRADAEDAPRGALVPHLLVHTPARASGVAIAVFAGGGYRRIEHAREGAPACRWLASIGIAAFEVIYRLPGQGCTVAAPFADGARAMRLVRGLAPRYGFDAGRVGVLGFSAGAHLAGMTATVTRQDALPVDGHDVDAIDALSAKPDFAALLYPVLTMMPPWNTTRAASILLGPNPPLARCAAYSVERRIGAGCPRLFLAQAADDPIAPLANSLLAFQAARAANVPAELHVFETGGHGWGMGVNGTEPAAWPKLLRSWIDRA